MFLGVPVLKRYDLLERLLASAEAGSQNPSGYLIVDNGGEFRARIESSDIVRRLLERGADVRVLEPGSNIGVAAAWNAILDEAGEKLVVISNDDVELGAETISTLLATEDGTERLLLADAGPDASGWCLFLHSRSLFKRIGPYDESFYPAYYEDSDYRWRMKLEGLEPVLVKTDFKHAVRGSWSDESKKHIRRGLEQFERKWGGDPRGDESLLFRQPFDGAPVAYSLRNKSYRAQWRKLMRKIYRWDIVNTIAKKIDAKTYLEIGVGSGESMRHVNIPWKMGVDPAPSGDCGANVFYRMTSDKFFSETNPHRFDIVFVDGLHHAEQAYRDIENACALARFVVVHDANPSTREMQEVPQRQGEWTGDVWKAIARIRDQQMHVVRTVDTDYGVAVILPNKGPRAASGSKGGRGASGVELPRETWEDLERNRAALLGLASFDEFEAWFDSNL